MRSEVTIRYSKSTPFIFYTCVALYAIRERFRIHTAQETLIFFLTWCSWFFRWKLVWILIFSKKIYVRKLHSTANFSIHSYKLCTKHNMNNSIEYISMYKIHLKSFYSILFLSTIFHVSNGENTSSFVVLLIWSLSVG